MIERLQALLKKNLSLLCCGIAALPCQAALSAGDNTLSLGENSPIYSQLDLLPNAPQDLNFKSKAEILAIRTQLAGQYPQLLLHEYQPSAEVFEKIEDGKPWWGLHGESLWGEGKRSIEGAAEESRFLLNPFLLVGANPYTYNIWDPARTGDDDMSRPDFPFTWLPRALHWWPRKATAEAVYAVSDYNAQLYNRRNKLRVEKISPKFALVAYNARDFGYQYLWVATDRSVNIQCLRKPSNPTKITQMIHCGNTCGYPGGCNNMSPSLPEIDELAYCQLPARALIYLWKDKPRDAKQPPDMTFILTLE